MSNKPNSVTPIIPAKTASHRVTDELVDLIPYVRIDIVCRNDLVKTVVAVTQKAVHPGPAWRWKALHSPVEPVFRPGSADKEAKKLRRGWLLVLCVVLLMIAAAATDLYFIAYERHQRDVQHQHGSSTNSNTNTALPERKP